MKNRNFLVTYAKEAIPDSSFFISLIDDIARYFPDEEIESVVTCLVCALHDPEIHLKAQNSHFIQFATRYMATPSVPGSSALILPFKRN